MNYRACIVEDDKENRDQLTEYLRRYEKTKQCTFTVTAYGDALDFLEEFKGNFDLIFMDIELPYLNGLEVVKRIREKDKRVIVIFVTNMAQYAVKGYEVDALDFIVKPVSYSGFSLKLDRALERLKQLEEREIWITDRNGKRRLYASAIKYVEVVHHNVIYHTTDGDYTAYGQLKDVCAALEGAPFALCNRCFLVNLQFVTAIEELFVTVSDEKLQISRNRKKAFLKSLNEYLGGK